MLGFVSLGMVIPIHVTLLPNFIWFGLFGLIDNHLGLIIPYVAFQLSFSTLVIAATFGQPGTAQTILPNALQAGHDLVLALNHAFDPGARSGSLDRSDSPPRGPGR